MARRRLTDQQKARIARIQELRRQRLARRDARNTTAVDAPRMGRVVVRYGSNLLIEGETGHRRQALFRANVDDVVCGDTIVWQPTDDDGAVVIAVEPRTSALTRTAFDGRERPIVANISQLVIVLAANPPPAGYLLDQYLVAAEHAGVGGVIALNKADLLNAESRAQFVADYAHYDDLGYPIVQISAKTEHGLDPLRDRLCGETSILVGQSGVGKSSLINALIPHEQAWEGALSDATGLGRHTTSATTLYALESGGELIDSPGVRSFRLGDIDRETLARGFREFVPLLGRCRFHNCAHLNEPGCAIAAATEAGDIHPERLASYRHMARAIGAN